MRNELKNTILDRRFLTLVVTENCNLACKYCYEVHKNNKGKMSFEVAKKAIDMVIDTMSDESIFYLDFMGGEPFLEIDLMDKICDYMKFRLYEEKHHWFTNYNITVSSNGTLYGTEKVQKFIKKNYNQLFVGITLDGTKEKHDLQRVKKDGTGSFDDVIKNIDLYLKQFPNAATKVTFASDDLKYLKDSIVYLYSLGFKDVSANVVLEDVWKPGDDQLFMNQLIQLADYLIDNNLDESFSGGFFEERIGIPNGKERMYANWCNCGENVAAVDYNGDLYPCTRFLPFTLNNRKEGRKIGNLNSGVDINLVRSFEALELKSQSSEECLNCVVASGCAWCQGNNFDFAKSDTIYSRETNICKMHKARCRANDYFFARLRNEKNRNRNIFNKDRKRYLYIMMSNKSVSYCRYNAEGGVEEKISLENFCKGLEFARQHFLMPVILHDNSKLDESFSEKLRGFEAKHIVPCGCNESYFDRIDVINTDEVDCVEGCSYVICHVDRAQISQLGLICEKLFDFEAVKKVHIVLSDYNLTEKEQKIYKEQLQIIKSIIIKHFREKHFKQINLLTNILLTKEMEIMSCNAGTQSFTLAPNGKFYLCPAFYYDNRNEYLEFKNEERLTTEFSDLLTISKSPICSECDATHCQRCVFDNKKKTLEYNIPSREQCIVSHIERSISYELQKELMEINDKTPFSNNILAPISYDDPFILLQDKKLRV